jgi:hypothetical protein
MSETELCQRPARAQLRWADEWARRCTYDVDDVEEEHTMWLRNAARPVAMEHRLRLDAMLGRTRKSQEKGCANQSPIFVGWRLHEFAAAMVA